MREVYSELGRPPGAPLADWTDAFKPGAVLGQPLSKAQVPDVVDGRKACYQAIVEAEVVVTGNLRTKPLPGRFSCNITRHASHRIADTLGLIAERRAGDVSFHRPLLAGWASFDAQVGGGEIIREFR